MKMKTVDDEVKSCKEWREKGTHLLEVIRKCQLGIDKDQKNDRGVCY